MAAGYLSSGTLWAGFEFRNRQQEAALLGAREVGCDLASQCGKTCERGPNASFRPATGVEAIKGSGRSSPRRIRKSGPLASGAGSERKAPVPLVPPHITDTFDLGGLRWS